MKLFLIFTLLTFMIISCNDKDTTVTKDLIKSKQETNTGIIQKDSIDFEVINLATLETNKADTFYLNYINYYIAKNESIKVNEIWNFIRNNNLKLPKAYVSYAYYINLDKTKNDEAIAIYKEAIALDPSFHLPYKIIGNIYIYYNMMQDALNYLSHAHQLEPTDIEVINNIANIYFVNKQFDMSILYYTKAIETQPNEIVYFNRSICYDNIGKPNLAEKDRISAKQYKN